MPENNTVKVTDVWSVEGALGMTGDWGHLYEVQVPPNGLENFRERETYDTAGKLLVGDLVLTENSGRYLEMHPFPEWVVLLSVPNQVMGNAFLVLPKLPAKVLARLSKKPWEARSKQVARLLAKMPREDLFAIRYDVGTCVKVPANVPHYFLSKCAPDEAPPYLQVFEPSIPILGDVLGGPTAYHDLGHEISV
ncbi:MAG: hypothetical protein ACTSU5_07985 [Promethearchaeota archaeon]